MASPGRTRAYGAVLWAGIGALSATTRDAAGLYALSTVPMADLLAVRDGEGDARVPVRDAELAAWRKIRDEQIVPALHRGDVAAATVAVSGPLADADDAFSVPLDCNDHPDQMWWVNPDWGNSYNPIQAYWPSSEGRRHQPVTRN
jgi:hypothetical protein